MGNKPNRFKKLKNKALRKMSSESSSSAPENTKEENLNRNNPNRSLHPKSSSINKHITPSKSTNKKAEWAHTENTAADWNAPNYTKSASNWKSANNNHSKWNKNKKSAKAIAKDTMLTKRGKTVKTAMETTSYLKKKGSVSIWAFNHNLAKQMLADWKNVVEHVHLKNKPHHGKRTSPGSVDVENPKLITGHHNFDETMKNVNKGNSVKNARTAGKIDKRNSRKKAA